MSARLDSLVASASATPDWSPDRARRVRAGVVRRHEGNVRRDRLVRRGLLIGGAAGLLLIALLRGASSAPAEPQPTASAPAPTSEALASRALADAGYAHD